MKTFLTVFCLILLSSTAVLAMSESELLQRKNAITKEINALNLEYKEAGMNGDVAKVKLLRQKINVLVKERNSLSNEEFRGYAGDQMARIELFNKMKTCQSGSVRTLLFTETVTKRQDGYCGFKFAMNNNKAYTICNFPMPVANTFANETIKGIKQGVDLESTRAIINNPKYCKDYSAYKK